MATKIRVDEEVFAAIERAKHPGDTPSKVLRRLLLGGAKNLKLRGGMTHARRSVRPRKHQR